MMLLISVIQYFFKFDKKIGKMVEKHVFVIVSSINFSNVT
jgi:hypothetical protein